MASNMTQWIRQRWQQCWFWLMGQNQEQEELTRTLSPRQAELNQSPVPAHRQSMTRDVALSSLSAVDNNQQLVGLWMVESGKGKQSPGASECGSEGIMSEGSDSFYSVISGASRKEEVDTLKSFNRLKRTNSQNTASPLKNSKHSTPSLESSGAIQLNEMMMIQKSSSRYSVGEEVEQKIGSLVREFGLPISNHLLQISPAVRMRTDGADFIRTLRQKLEQFVVFQLGNTTNWHMTFENRTKTLSCKVIHSPDCTHPRKTSKTITYYSIAANTLCTTKWIRFLSSAQVLNILHGFIQVRLVEPCSAARGALPLMQVCRERKRGIRESLIRWELGVVEVQRQTGSMEIVEVGQEVGEGEQLWERVVCLNPSSRGKVEIMVEAREQNMDGQTFLQQQFAAFNDALEQAHFVPY